MQIIHILDIVLLSILLKQEFVLNFQDIDSKRHEIYYQEGVKNQSDLIINLKWERD